MACPACGSLVHADRLKQLATEAEQAEASGNPTEALARWNEALPLLPGNASQRAAIAGRIERLERRLHAGSGQTAGKPRQAGLRGLWLTVGAGVLFLLTKAKFLLLGLTKMGTLLSMVAFFGVYWGVYGWKFALGLVLSIYVHEMGHVAALRRYGIPATAPMFIPGIGALIRLKAHPPTVGQDARVGLAGPVWGTAAALAALGIFQLTRDGLYASLAHVGAVINLFNLIPVWQLDGGRGIAALSRSGRGLLLVVAIGTFLVLHEGMLLLIAIGLGVQTFTRAPEETDRPVLLEFAALLIGLGLLATVRVPGLVGR